MWFYLTLINPHNQTRKFSFFIMKIGLGFDVLSMLVATGVELISVQIVDGNSTIDLPVEVFGGNALSEAINELENEWLAILTRPILP